MWSVWENVQSQGHLQHCTGHRPPQLMQQQHTTVPPPTFTISHQYTSMGGAVKRYNIDMAWVIQAGMHPVDVHADRVEHIGRYDFSSLSFPCPLQSIDHLTN